MAMQHVSEPDLQAAMGWWTEIPGKYTVVGWKNHMFRFCVLHNGTIMAKPDVEARTHRWDGLGVQTFG